MQLYFENLLSRLATFSQTLDKKEIFIEKPWVIIDEKHNHHKYIFKRNGELIMSLNGTVKIGKWDYIEVAKSLLIDRIDDKILLNQTFIDFGVMVLKKDGQKQEQIILINELLVEDLDVIRYLKTLFYQKNYINTIATKNNQLLELNQYGGFIDGNKVTIDGEIVPDGIVTLKSNKKLRIKDSKIINVLIESKIRSNEIELIIEHEDDISISKFSKGNKVQLQNMPAPDGKYKVGFLRSINIKNGIII